MNPFVILITIFFALIPVIYLSYIIYLQLIPGAFYYPSTPKTVKDMIRLSHPKPNDVLIDLGSGDGRIVIAAAKMGLKSIGYELNPFLVIRSRRLIKQLKLSHLAKIKLKNFWKINFNQADIIILYQFPKYVNKLQKILDQTLTHPVTVISNDYPFTNKKPILTKDKIFIYRFP